MKILEPYKTRAHPQAPFSVQPARARTQRTQAHTSAPAACKRAPGKSTSAYWRLLRKHSHLHTHTGARSAARVINATRVRAHSATCNPAAPRPWHSPARNKLCRENSREDRKSSSSRNTTRCCKYTTLRLSAPVQQRTRWHCGRQQRRAVFRCPVRCPFCGRAWTCGNPPPPAPPSPPRFAPAHPQHTNAHAL